MYDLPPPIPSAPPEPFAGHTPAPSAPPAPPTTPRCWKCGYELTGLQVTDRCPECATPVWSTPTGAPPGSPAQLEPDALVWGIVAIVLLFACLGPFAGFVAIPAVIKGRRAMELVRTGRYPKESASQARTGLILGWVTIGLSLGMVVVWGVVVLVRGL